MSSKKYVGKGIENSCPEMNVQQGKPLPIMGRLKRLRTTLREHLCSLSHLNSTISGSGDDDSMAPDSDGISGVVDDCERVANAALALGRIVNEEITGE